MNTFLFWNVISSPPWSQLYYEVREMDLSNDLGNKNGIPRYLPTLQSHGGIAICRVSSKRQRVGSGLRGPITLSKELESLQKLSKQSFHHIHGLPSPKRTIPSLGYPLHSQSKSTSHQNHSLTPQRQSQLEETPRKVPSKSPPFSRTSLMHSLSNLTVSDRVKKYRDDLKQAVETPLSQRMEMEIPSPLDLGMRMQVSGDSADEFWMDWADFKNQRTYDIDHYPADNRSFPSTAALA